MKTLSEIICWLKQPDHIRVVLVEIDGVLIQGTSSTLYLSNKPYTSQPTDTNPNIYYQSCINGGITFSESLDLEGQPSIGYGDIELDNTNGCRDSWLNYVWANRDINIYLGDPRWSRDDYYKIFTGVVSDISSRDSNTLNIIILDRLERINKPLTEEVMGGAGNNKDAVKPILFGECFNIEPVITDSVPNVLEYMVNGGQIEDIIEVRDNGLPVLFSKNLANGTFNLLRSPAGQITASAQGSKSITYSNNIANLVQYIVTTYGPANSRLNISDIDTANFNTFATTNTQSVGIYCRDRENVLDVCQKLASSIGAAVTVDKYGKLRLVKLDMPGSGTSYDVNTDDIEFGSLSISEKPIVKGSVKLAYCKNWTPQTTNLAGGLPSNHISIFTDEWYYSNTSNPQVLADYKLYEQPQQEDTYLISQTDALAESNRRLNLWSTPRYIITGVFYAHMLVVELGDTINITHPRFGLDTQKTGLIISIDRDWLSGRVTIGVLV